MLFLFLQKSYTFTKANFIRKLPERGLISPLCPWATYPTHNSGWRVCVCVWFILFCTCWHKNAHVDDVPCWPRPAGCAVFSSASPLWLVFGGFLFNFSLRYRVCVILNINESPSQAPLSCPILHVLVAWLVPLAMLIKRFSNARQLQRWQCATWWVCLRIDRVQGRVDKWKWGFAGKFSGESEALQMGTSSHINSFCFTFVPKYLQISFHCPVSSALSCPL